MDPKTQIKMHRLVERFWLLVVIVTSLVTAWWWYRDGMDAHKWAPVIPALALLWYLLRRFMRKRLEKHLSESDDRPS